MVFSLDGPKAIQDRNRVSPNGHGTYDIVMSKIFRMYESDPDKLKGDAISMVITPEHSFDEIVQSLSEPTLQNVNLLYSYVEENSETILPSREYLEQYRYCSFVSLIEYLRGQDKMYQNKLMESDMTGMEADLDPFISHGPVNTSAPSGPCIPGRNRLFVNCFGSFYPCEKVSEDFCMNIGSIDSGFDVSKVASILNIGQLDPQKCQNCFAFTLCSVCAKYVDGGESLSVEKRDKACQESKILRTIKYLRGFCFTRTLFTYHQLKCERKSKYEESYSDLSVYKTRICFTSCLKLNLPYKSFDIS